MGNCFPFVVHASPTVQGSAIQCGHTTYGMLVVVVVEARCVFIVVCLFLPLNDHNHLSLSIIPFRSSSLLPRRLYRESC